MLVHFWKCYFVTSNYHYISIAVILTHCCHFRLFFFGLGCTISHSSCIMLFTLICFLSQSTHDSLLAFGALIACSAICSIITSPKWFGRSGMHYPRQGIRKYGQAEFLSRSPTVGSGGRLWNSPKIPMTPSWSYSPVKGMVCIFRFIGFYTYFGRY